MEITWTVRPVSSKICVNLCAAVVFPEQLGPVKPINFKLLSSAIRRAVASIRSSMSRSQESTNRSFSVSDVKFGNERILRSGFKKTPFREKATLTDATSRARHKTVQLLHFFHPCFHLSNIHTGISGKTTAGSQAFRRP